MIRFHCLQHVSFETPGNIEVWATQKGHSFSFTHFFHETKLPDQDAFDALIIMGGPMSIHDETNFPWLKKEKAFIKAAIQHHKKILGICLGAQLIADVLGAKVYPNKYKEIGFMPVRFTREALKSDLFTGIHEEETVFHWHGETFDLPKDATHLGSSEACKNQAFAIGNQILAFQFHPEVSPEIITQMIEHGKGELVTAAYVHDAKTMFGDLHYLDSSQQILFHLLDKFFV